jgi:choline/glycine/proline betaine transport protein
MCYTVYLGLDNEYEILESEAFADRIQDMTAEGDIDVVTSGDEMVTDISDADDTASSSD